MPIWFKQLRCWMTVLALLLLWWLLTSGTGFASVSSWLMLLVAIALVLWLSCPKSAGASLGSRTNPGLPNHQQGVALLRLMVFFVHQSLFGGVDVARRALSARSVQPDYLNYTMRLQNPKAQSLFIALIGLMPGTVAVAVHGAQVRIHRLDRDMAVLGAVKQLETLLAQTLADRQPDRGDA